MNELGRNLQYAATNISSELQQVREDSCFIENTFSQFFQLQFFQVDISSAKFYVDEYETDVLSYEFYR